MRAGAASVTIIPGQLAQATAEPRWVKYALLVVALGFLVLFVGVPLLLIFIQAFEKGWEVYLAALTEPDAKAAIKLTLLVALIAVPLNARRHDRVCDLVDATK